VKAKTKKATYVQKCSWNENVQKKAIIFNSMFKTLSLLQLHLRTKDFKIQLYFNRKFEWKYHGVL